MKYCNAFAVLLQRHCNIAAKALQYRCRTFAAMLYCPYKEITSCRQHHL